MLIGVERMHEKRMYGEGVWSNRGLSSNRGSFSYSEVEINICQSQ